MKFFLEGFWLSIAYIVPIGMQNLYPGHSALKSNRPKSEQAALITSFLYIAFGMSCFLGIGPMLSRFPEIKKLLVLVGNMAMIYIGMDLALAIPKIGVCEYMDELFEKTATNSVAGTWFNLKAIMKGALLFGGVRASLANIFVNTFISGIVVAWLVWLLSQALLNSLFRNSITGKHLQIIQLFCGVIMISYGLIIAYRLLKIS